MPVSMLKGKNILLGVTGSIAAYKSALLVRLLVKQGCNVKVIMTPAAKDFITPLTLSTLSKNPVLSDFFIGNSGEWNNHVELGLWADLMLIAPASANTISSMAIGRCDNLLLATYLSAKCKVLIAPAMDLDMFKHKSTKENLKRIQSFGNIVINPGNGELASGLHGEGRMAEPEEIIKEIEVVLKKKLPLVGKRILVTAGPTYEAIDPVRFIGNHSSGKMGFAIAEEFGKLGAEVILISGPTYIQTPSNIFKRINVVSAHEMHEAVISNFSSSNIIVMCAAVADFKPAKVEKSKIKKKDAVLELNLEPTVDILKDLGKRKKNGQFLVGFALETNNGEKNAKDKLKAKKLDMIVLNVADKKNNPFGSDMNSVVVMDKHNKTHNFGLMSKQEIAQQLISLITKK